VVSDWAVGGCYFGECGIGGLEWRWTSACEVSVAGLVVLLMRRWTVELHMCVCRYEDMKHLTDSHHSFNVSIVKLTN